MPDAVSTPTQPLKRGSAEYSCDHVGFNCAGMEQPDSAMRVSELRHAPTSVRNTVSSTGLYLLVGLLESDGRRRKRG